MKKKNQTTINRTCGDRVPDKTKEYVIGNNIYIVNSFFAENEKTTVKDIVERLAVRELNRNNATRPESLLQHHINCTVQIEKGLIK